MALQIQLQVYEVCCHDLIKFQVVMVAARQRFVYANCRPLGGFPMRERMELQAVNRKEAQVVAQSNQD